MRTRLLLYAALLLSIVLPGILPAQANAPATQSAPAASAALPPGALPLDKIQNQADLDRTIAALDAALFDGYNRCDLAEFSALVDENVEFYHDSGGITLGNAALTDSIRKNICGRTTRELVPGTLKAYYMKGIGAVEFATHRFFHPAGSTDDPGEAETVMLWRYKDGAWKITRVFSYDHHRLTTPTTM